MKVFEVPEIGVVNITKRKNVRSYKLRIDERGKISMSMPANHSYRSALGFIEKNTKWVLEHKQKLQSQQIEPRFRTGKTYRSLLHDFTIVSTTGKHIQIRKLGSSHQLLIPETASINSDKYQDFIENTYVNLLRKEAKSYLPSRIHELAGKYNFNINRVSIKNQRTRWGSCSSVNNINLNLHLMRLPENLIDHVLIHELCHTIHKNHGKGFYRLLQHILPDYKDEANELRQYRLNKYHFVS